MLIFFYSHIHFALLREAELLLLLREALLADALLREALLLDDLDTEALLLLVELLLRATLLLDELLRELLDDTDGLVLLEALLLRETLLFDALLRDTLLLEELLRLLLDDTLLLLEGLLLLREPVTAAEPLRELLKVLLRDALAFEEVREEALGIIFVRRFSSESTFTTRLSLLREGTLTNPDLRSRLLFS